MVQAMLNAKGRGYTAPTYQRRDIRELIGVQAFEAAAWSAIKNKFFSKYAKRPATNRRQRCA